MVVVGIPVDICFVNDNKKIDRDYLDSLSDKEMYELALDLSESIIYDNEKVFFNELNDDLVDTENNYWFILRT